MRFHGELLMGGTAIRQVDGTFDETSLEGDHYNEGTFEVSARKESLIELGRPYLLIFDDGDSVKLVVDEIDATFDPGKVVVHFHKISA